VGKILGQVYQKLKDGVCADYITLAGSGEPTLNSEIGSLIHNIKKHTRIPVAVLTNGSLLGDSQVRESLMEADAILPSLDAHGQEGFEIINRPHPEISFETMAEGLIAFNPIAPAQEIRIGPGLTVRTVRLNHPNGSIGYRVEGPNQSVCIITDHEHPRDDLDENVVDFSRGATVLVHEAQYHPEEKRGEKAGWGHSSWDEAARVAKLANVKRLYLSHHDPVRNDSEVFDILSRARRLFWDTEIATETTVCDVGSLAD